MYSGTTLTKLSGRMMGAHQKIDRVARRHLQPLLIDNSVFPRASRILHFEGKNGPDAIKRKSPARDEPWHYYSPFDDEDSKLVDLINDHYNQLVKELKADNQERVAFEAAWLAHAIVDGLTPAHHYPYEKKLIELSGGRKIEDRTTLKKKLFLPGITTGEMIKNNWKMWGPKGLFTTHGLFELGVATLMMPLSFDDARPSKKDQKEATELSVSQLFKRTAREIASMNMYERYYEKGWTPTLAYEVRAQLGPKIIKTVTLAWYSALFDAGLTGKKSAAKKS